MTNVSHKLAALALTLVASTALAAAALAPAQVGATAAPVAQTDRLVA